MAMTSTDIVELVKALVWPTLIFLVLVVFPKRIKPIVYLISRVITKVSYAGTTIEFAQVKEFKSDLGHILSKSLF